MMSDVAGTPRVVGSRPVRPRRAAAFLALVVVAVVGTGLAIVGARVGRSAPRSGASLQLALRPSIPMAPAPPIATTSTTAAPVSDVPPSTPLASPNGTIPTFSAPGSPPTGTVAPWYGYALTLPVIDQRGAWLKVRLPLRPNGSMAWVRASDVSMSSTPYRIIVHLTRQELIVYRAGARVLAFPTGLGTAATPTPTGNYFVAVRETRPPPGYGPIILDTSAHSEAIQSWEGAGDAVIAIHGPITASADAQIGAAGARLSNGCIRLHDSDLAHLEMIPVGTPVDITN